LHAMEAPIAKNSRTPGASAGTADAAVYFMMLAVGFAVVVPTMTRQLAWGVQPTLGALLIVFAGRALVVTFVLRIRDRINSSGSRKRHGEIGPHGLLS
jgi:hypothetical protein